MKRFTEQWYVQLLISVLIIAIFVALVWIIIGGVRDEWVNDVDGPVRACSTTTVGDRCTY